MACGTSVRDLIPASANIRLLELTDKLTDKLTIGAKRNLGCAQALGKVIAHWDDDDFSYPGRLQDQVDRLASSGKAVTAYRSMKFTDGDKWWMYTGSVNYALGTSLCYRREWWDKHRFRPIQIAEDNGFADNALLHGQLATVDDQGLMYATNHSANTSPRQLGSNWRLL